MFDERLMATCNLSIKNVERCLSTRFEHLTRAV